MEKIKKPRTKYKNVNKESFKTVIKESNSPEDLNLEKIISNEKLEHKKKPNTLKNKDGSKFSNNSYMAAHWIVLSYVFAVLSLLSKEQGYCSLLICIALDITRSSNLKFGSIIRLLVKVS